MRRGCLLLLSLLALCAPASAAGEVLHAGDVDESNSPQAVALIRLAQEYWGASACQGHYQVIVGSITDQPAKVDGTELGAGGEAMMPGCWMRLIPSMWHETAFAWICAAFVHEYGHSLGHPHSTDPKSVMDPLTAYDQGMPTPECAAPVVEGEEVVTAAEPVPAVEAVAVPAGLRAGHRRHRRRHRKHRVRAHVEAIAVPSLIGGE